MWPARWRTLGYVPDSEESDDDPNPPPEEPNHNHSPRVFIPAAAPHSPGPVLRQSPPLDSIEPCQDAPDLDSDSSELSSLSKLFEDSPNLAAFNEPHGDSEVNGLPWPDADERENHAQLGFRRLRQRQEVQKHPYTIEEARYRRILKDRGEAPIRVVINSQRRGSRENLSQSPTSDAQPNSRPSSLVADPRLSIGVDTSVAAQTRVVRMPGSSRQKRRRVVQSDSDSDSDALSSPTFLRASSKWPLSGGRLEPKPTISSSPQTSLPSALRYDSSDPGSDRPPSRSSEASTVGGFTSPSDPVPFARSSQPPRDPHNPVYAVISSGPESAGVSENEEDAVERVGRRLKGVLPRSWVRLELQKQGQQSSKKPSAPKTTLQAAGVARRRQGGHPADAAALITFDDSDASDSVAASPTVYRRAPALPRLQPDAPLQSAHEPLSSPGSEMEHDVIDLTVPSRRSKANGSNPRVRQQRSEGVRPRQSNPAASHRVPGLSMQSHRRNPKPKRSTIRHDLSAMQGQAVRRRRSEQSSIRKYTITQTVEDVDEERRREQRRSHQRPTSNPNANRREAWEGGEDAETEKASRPRSRAVRQKPAHFRTAQLESLESEFKGRNHRSAFQTSLLKASSNYKIQSRMIVSTEPPRNQTETSLQRRTTEDTDSWQESGNEAFDLDARQDLSPPGYAAAEANLQPAEFVSGSERIHSVDFGIVRLAGELLQKDSFIGSGEFETAISMTDRDMDIPTAHHVVHSADTQCVWTAWDQGLAAGVKTMLQSCRNVVGEFPKTLNSGALEIVGDVLRQMLFANSNHLYFLDPIDRKPFRKDITILLQPLVDATVGAMGNDQNSTLLRILVLEMAMAAQLLAVGSEDEPSQLRDMILLAATTILRTIIQNGLSAIRDFIHAGRLAEHETEVESVVAVYHTLKRVGISEGSFWDIVATVLEPRVSTAADTTALDATWLALFTFLPILEVDANGALSRDRDLGREGWKVLRPLVDKTLALFSAGSQSTNNYIRTTLRRCHALVQRWGWSQCEGLIGAVFDFFSNNKLAPLPNETVHGSPEFLSRLDGGASLDILPGDHSFGIFLKLLSVALVNLKRIHAPAKIAGIIWRCVPNHDRRHRKEDDLREADLDALRNHHDLLCTLFWHAPDAIRPRLQRLMRGLVDHGVSHQEVCRLNVNTWLRIARLLLSAQGNPLELSEWFQDFTNQAVAQYRLARVETEAHASGVLGRLGQSRIEEHIKRNQEPVLHTIHIIVTAMKLAINSASSKAQVDGLLRDTSLDKVLGLAVYRREILSEIMSVYSSFIALPETTDGAIKSDESQEFGDWPEDVSIDFVTANVFSALSNVLAAERAIDDDSILLVVDTWVQVIATLLRREEKSLGAFLDPYQKLSWHRLSGDLHCTVTPYFYARLLSNVPFDAYPNRFLGAWTSSLVEREAYLRFQHELTSAILNASSHPVLANLPFSREKSGQYTVLRHQLKQRRLALLAGILSNMQATYDPKPSTDSQQYVTIVQEMMSSMKRNFAEIKQYSVANGDSAAKGKYVDFVHSVVGLLQQHTSGFCAVDAFFTDSAVFPLPENDPTYVVAKLRSYATHGDDPSMTKRLASFFQTLAERAAIDQQQDSFAKQLELSMLGGLRGERVARLWEVLVGGIVPVFLEACACRGLDCLFAPPILRAMSGAFDGIQYLYSQSPRFAELAAQLAAAALGVAHRSAVHVMRVDPLLEDAGSLRLLACIFRLVTSTLPCLDRASRQSGEAHAGISIVRFFWFCSIRCAQIMTGLAPPCDAEEPPVQHADRYSLGHTVAHRLDTSWLKKDGNIFFTDNGRSTAEVTCRSGTAEEEGRGLGEAIEELHDVLDRMTGVVFTTGPWF